VFLKIYYNELFKILLRTYWHRMDSFINYEQQSLLLGIEWLFEANGIPIDYFDEIKHPQVEQVEQVDQIVQRAQPILEQQPSEPVALPQEQQPTIEQAADELQHPKQLASKRKTNAGRPPRGRNANSRRLKYPCPHKARKANCWICNPQDFCHHQIHKYYCLPCGGRGTCEHGRKRTTCRQCGGGSICEHGKQRSSCVKCGYVRKRRPHVKIADDNV